MKVAAIVPAFNEESRIGTVLPVLKESPDVDEIIVVDDGSEDRTAEIARSLGVRVIGLKENVGKGGALKRGAEATDADVLLFIDADLIGLNVDHVHALIAPLHADEEVDMVCGRFVKGRAQTNWSQKLAPHLNSQRAIRRGFLNTVPDYSRSRFGVEMIMTKHARKTDARVKKVLLAGLTQVMKEEKLGRIKGTKDRLKMYGEIVKHM